MLSFESAERVLVTLDDAEADADNDTDAGDTRMTGYYWPAAAALYVIEDGAPLTVHHVGLPPPVRRVPETLPTWAAVANKLEYEARKALGYAGQRDAWWILKIQPGPLGPDVHLALCEYRVRHHLAHAAMARVFLPHRSGAGHPVVWVDKQPHTMGLLVPPYDVSLPAGAKGWCRDDAPLMWVDGAVPGRVFVPSPTAAAAAHTHWPGVQLTDASCAASSTRPLPAGTRLYFSGTWRKALLARAPAPPKPPPPRVDANGNTLPPIQTAAMKSKRKRDEERDEEARKRPRGQTSLQTFSRGTAAPTTDALARAAPPPPLPQARATPVPPTERLAHLVKKTALERYFETAPLPSCLTDET